MMGPSLSPACNPTFGEEPKPEQVLSLTFGNGPENPSIMTVVTSKITRLVRTRGGILKDGL